MSRSKVRMSVQRKAIIYGITFGLILIILFYMVSTIINDASPAKGKFAPDFTLDDFDGNAVTLSQYRGHPVLLDFMSTSCSDCNGDMPNLTALYKDYSQKGVIFLSISYGGEDAPVLKAYLKGYGAGWKGLLGTGPVKQDYGIDALPTYLMIDPNGARGGSLSGHQTFESLKALVASGLP